MATKTYESNYILDNKVSLWSWLFFVFFSYMWIYCCTVEWI